MGYTARLFNCANCKCQVIIGSCCDRGNIYCGGTCAPLARKKSQRDASKRYQSTKQGKSKHAARQAAYRKRQKQKVTHHGSLEAGSYAELKIQPADVLTTNKIISSVTKQTVICDFCGNSCSTFVRTRFINYQKNKNHSTPTWPMAP
jgi:hypothetical protein